MKPTGLVRIWSNEHDAWWRENSHGYTRHVDEAGMYERAIAERICKEAGKLKGGRPCEEIRELTPHATLLAACKSALEFARVFNYTGEKMDIEKELEAAIELVEGN
jgi:hypothetical protein